LIGKDLKLESKREIRIIKKHLNELKKLTDKIKGINNKLLIESTEIIEEGSNSNSIYYFYSNGLIVQKLNI